MMRRALTVTLLTLFGLWAFLLVALWLANQAPGGAAGRVLLLVKSTPDPEDTKALLFHRLDPTVRVLQCEPSVTKIAALLERERLVRSAALFRKAGAYFGLERRMVHGWYRLDPGLSMVSLLQRLASKQPGKKIFVSPGEAYAPLAGRFARAGLRGDLAYALRQAARGRPLSVLPASLRLYPGLYVFQPERDSASSLAREALDRFDRALGSFVRLCGLEGEPWEARLRRAAARELGGASVDPVSPSLGTLLTP